MPEFCQTERTGHILTVTLNRPKLLNALHPPAHVELAEIFDAFEADPELWVAIITGAGERGFCAGNDLKYQAAGKGEITTPPSGFGGVTSRYDCVKPMIAAVNGVAMGGGFEIALACDMIIASDRATFALPEPRVGLAALAGGIHRLPRQIGLKNAMGMMLTGRRVDAEEGQRLGFVNEVVAHEELMPTALRWAAMIEECTRLQAGSHAGARHASHRGRERPLRPALRDAQERGLHRRPARLRREAQAQLEGPLATEPAL